MTAKPYKRWLGRLVAGKVSFGDWGGEGPASLGMAGAQDSMVFLLLWHPDWGRPRFVIGLKSNRSIGDVGPRIPPIQRWALQ